MYSHRGFTLLELVLAIAVFGIMAGLAYGGLNSLSTQGRWLSQESDRFTQIQKSLYLMESDIQFAVRRGVRDALGSDVAEMTGGTDERLLALTKAQRPREDGGNLVRIHYVKTGDTLQRKIWPALDRLPEHQAITADLLTKLEHVEIRFLGIERWHTSWPLGSRPVERDHPLPRAIELTLELSGGEYYRRVFPVSGNT